MAFKNIRVWINLCFAVFILAGCAQIQSHDKMNDDSIVVEQKKDVKRVEKIKNPYFPYNSNQERIFNGRFYFSDLLKKQTTVYIQKEKAGNQGEIWRITFERVEYDSYDTDGRYQMPDECLDLYYFLIQNDVIYWYSVPEMPEEEMKAFCEEGIIPKDYTHVVCQEEEKKDVLSDEESGDHEEISACGKDKDIRQFKTWYIKPDFSDTLDIYTFVFKKNIGFIAYRNSWTAARKNAVQLWDESHVHSKGFWKEFRYE